MANSFAANVTSAQVLAVQGPAWVTDANGNKTPLTANDQIRLNDLLNTDTQSVLMLAIGRDAVVTLGQSEKMRFDKAFLTQLDNKEVEGSIQGAVNFDAIEQAIAEGRSLDDVLPSAAAGETGGGDGSAGTSGVRIDLTAERVTPDSGFETNTQGFDGNRRFEDIGGRDSDGLFVAAPMDDILGVGAAVAKSSLEFFHRGRQQEDEADVLPPLAHLARAADLDFHGQLVRFCERSFERVPAGAVPIAGVLRVLEKSVSIDEPAKFCGVDERVIDAVALARARCARRV